MKDLEPVPPPPPPEVPPGRRYPPGVAGYEAAMYRIAWTSVAVLTVVGLAVGIAAGLLIAAA